MFQPHNGADVKNGINNGMIDESILSCFCYFDIFDYPLKIHELHAFLPGAAITRDALEEKLLSYPLTKLIANTEDFYYLYDRDAEIISRREQAERFAEQRWIPAKQMTKLIKMFPFVRAVMISGDLSKNVSSSESDIDYFILTEPGRLWITRTLLILFKKTVLFNDRTYYCLNFFRTTDNLNFDSMQDYFTATELATLKALYNTGMFDRLLENNRWVYSFFPNYRLNGRHNGHSSDTPSTVQSILESILSLLPLDRLDTRLMKYMQRMWRRRYRHLSDEEITYRFRCTKDESTAFAEESKRDIMSRYRTRRESVLQSAQYHNEYERS